VTGDEVRDTTFLITWGKQVYDAAEVDDLLRRVAAEIDAGRPVEPLIENATFRSHKYGYDPDAVDWFLEQLRLDHRDLTVMSQDPWRDLAVTAQFNRSEIGHLTGPGWPARKALRRYYSEECWKASRQYFDELPGVHLGWEWTGIAQRELRTEDKQTIACRREGRRPAYSAGGRKFDVLGDELADEAGIPILYTMGRHYNGSSRGLNQVP
jgi:DivIVA domain-containing protein